MEQFLLIAFTLYVLFICVQADCQVSNPRDTQSTELLKKLQPLNGLTFRYTYVNEKSDKYNYTLSICNAVKVNGYTDTLTGVLQEDNQNNLFKSVGRINNTMVKGGTDWIMLTYSDGDYYHSHCQNGTRQAHIMIVCDPYEKAGNFKVLYENNLENRSSNYFYMMELTSNIACNDVPTGLSSGSVFLIVFFSFALAYLIFGAIYKRCVYGSKGWNQIPNIGFWKSCGTLQADGCNFLCRCSDSAYSSSRPYQGIADDQLDDEVDDEHLLPM